LEFDIGFLLGDYFLIRRQRLGLQEGGLRAFDRYCVIANADARSLRHWYDRRIEYGIWYARNEVVKPPYRMEVPKTGAT
jgi:hypothetical protein